MSDDALAARVAAALRLPASHQSLVAQDLAALVADLWGALEQTRVAALLLDENYKHTTRERDEARAEAARLRALLSTIPTWGEHCAGLADDLPICGEVVDSELCDDGVVDWVCVLPNGHTGPCWDVEERDNPPTVRDRILSAIATEPDPKPGTEADVLADAASNVRGTTTTKEG